VLKKYKLIEKVADRAGRETWKAADRQTGRIVALKFVPVLSWKDAELLQREAEVLQQLSHPGIPKYIDYFENGDRVVLVREWVEGKPLSVGERLYNETEIVNIACQILEAIVYLHSQNPPVVHRDIKPSNIVRDSPAGTLREREGKLHLIDFGAVRVSPPIEGASFTVVGSSGYTPMEQFWGRAEARSDIYSLGMTLIALLTGVRPDELPRDRDEVKWRANISQRLKAIIGKMTAWDVRDRPSASEVLAELDGVVLPEDGVPAGLRLLVKGPSEDTLALAKMNRSLLSPGAEKPLKVLERIALAGIIVCGSIIPILIFHYAFASSPSALSEIATDLQAIVLTSKEYFETTDIPRAIEVSLDALRTLFVIIFLVNLYAFVRDKW